MGNLCTISISVEDTLSRLWDCTAGQANNICKLKENLHALRSATEELADLKNDVNRKLNIAGEHQLEPLDQVNRWISRVEVLEGEIDEIMKISAQETEKLCFGGCCSTNCRSSFKFGKQVVRKLEDVATLKSKGAFEMVADSVPTARVDEIPSDPTVGLESMFDKVWSCLGDTRVGIIGLYGMGGVGKTTLLTQINNKYISLHTDFDFVIWVVVSKDLSLEKIQDDIWKRIGIFDNIWKEKNREEKAKEIFKMLRKKKFVLLLDDIWERVDLTKVGVPLPDQINKSKLVFTTRSEEVCGRMEVHRKIKVECLPWEKAWELFQRKVGEDALNLHREIPKLAECVAKECGGLPLALITIGRAMACKKTPQEWNHALKVLRKSAAEFSGMGDEVFPLLKFSYDSLPNDIVRSCFLYCTLFPEDFLIRRTDLIDYWIGEGFFDESSEISSAQHQGYDFIGTLLYACLLEDEGEFVKMHDVIRDMALWIACECGKVKNNYLVQAGARLVETPETQKWEGAKRISLMSNDIRDLTEVPKCPNLLTLFLNVNHLKTAIDGFFEFMPALQVLNLSGNRGITKLPLGISKLVSLQYLNLSITGITQLPIELRSLDKLKYLNLDSTDELSMIPRQVLSSFSKLQVCKMFRCGSSNPVVEGNVLSGGNEALVEELLQLKNLDDLGITLRSPSALQMLLKSQKLQSSTRKLRLQFLSGTSILDISSLENVQHLDSLDIVDCISLKELKIDWQSEGREIQATENLGIPTIRHERCFNSLDKVYIRDCRKISHLTWVIFAPNIKELKVLWCSEIEELIKVGNLGGAPEAAANLKPFPKLKYLYLQNLPQLKSIYSNTLPFPELEEIKISYCPKLKKLPLNSDRAQGCKIVIKGEENWWKELEWEDEATRNAFLPSFKCLK